MRLPSLIGSGANGAYVGFAEGHAAVRALRGRRRLGLDEDRQRTLAAQRVRASAIADARQSKGFAGSRASGGISKARLAHCDAGSREGGATKAAGCGA